MESHHSYLLCGWKSVLPTLSLLKISSKQRQPSSQDETCGAMLVEGPSWKWPLVLHLGMDGGDMHKKLLWAWLGGSCSTVHPSQQAGLGLWG